VRKAVAGWMAREKVDMEAMEMKVEDLGAHLNDSFYGRQHWHMMATKQ